jgi:ferredoxin
MPYVITDACIKDFICAEACSTDAIHPVIGDADADTVPQLFINPDDCIDCGNCAASCTKDAIYPIDDLPAEKTRFAEANRAYYQ